MGGGHRCAVAAKGGGAVGGGRSGQASSALPPGLYTAYSAHLHRDKALLKRLLKVQAGGGPRSGARVGGVCLLFVKGCIGVEPMPPLPLGAAEEEAMGHTDSTAETAPPGAHAELHHPPGEARAGGGGGRGPWPQAHSPPPPGTLHGQPHAPAEEHHTLEGAGPGGGLGKAWEGGFLS